jgi:large subunit ribosomal protein L14
MIQAGSLLKIVDNSGITLVKCIKVLTTFKSRIAYMGDLIIVSVKHMNPKKLKKIKMLRRKRYLKGSLHRAMLIRSCSFFKRMPSIIIRFNENSAIIVNKKKIPLTNRVYGPVLRELCMRIPALGCVSRFII